MATATRRPRPKVGEIYFNDNESIRVTRVTRAKVYGQIRNGHTGRFAQDEQDVTDKIQGFELWN